MTVWLKIVVVGLLALALPAQGLAAVSQLHCGQSPQTGHLVQSQFELPDSAAHAHHTAGAATHHHDAGLDEPAPAAGSDTDTDTDTEQPPSAAKVGCSVCAACCTAALLAGDGPRVWAPEAAPASFATLVRSIEAVASDGPDRPPRIALA